MEREISKSRASVSTFFCALLLSATWTHAQISVTPAVEKQCVAPQKWSARLNRCYTPRPIKKVLPKPKSPEPTQNTTTHSSAWSKLNPQVVNPFIKKSAIPIDLNLMPPGYAKKHKEFEERQEKQNQTAKKTPENKKSAPVLKPKEENWLEEGNDLANEFGIYLANTRPVQEFAKIEKKPWVQKMEAGCVGGGAMGAGAGALIGGVGAFPGLGGGCVVGALGALAIPNSVVKKADAVAKNHPQITSAVIGTGAGVLAGLGSFALTSGNLPAAIAIGVGTGLIVDKTVDALLENKTNGPTKPQVKKQPVKKHTSKPLKKPTPTTPKTVANPTPAPTSTSNSCTAFLSKYPTPPSDITGFSGNDCDCVPQAPKTPSSTHACANLGAITKSGDIGSAMDGGSGSAMSGNVSTPTPLVNAGNSKIGANCENEITKEGSAQTINDPWAHIRNLCKGNAAVSNANQSNGISQVNSQPSTQVSSPCDQDQSVEKSSNTSDDTAAPAKKSGFMSKIGGVFSDVVHKFKKSKPAPTPGQCNNGIDNSKTPPKSDSKPLNLKEIGVVGAYGGILGALLLGPVGLFLFGMIGIGLGYTLSK